MREQKVLKYRSKAKKQEKKPEKIKGESSEAPVAKNSKNQGK